MVKQDQASMYLVAIVGIVAVVGIVVLILNSAGSVSLSSDDSSGEVYRSIFDDSGAPFYTGSARGLTAECKLKCGDVCCTAGQRCKVSGDDFTCYTP